VNRAILPVNYTVFAATMLCRILGAFRVDGLESGFHAEIDRYSVVRVSASSQLRSDAKQL
jgi:hypothetical protein